MKKKILAVIALIVTATCLFTGCSGTKSSAETYKLSEIDDGYYIKYNDEYYPLVKNATKNYSASDSLASDVTKNSVATVWISEENDSIPVLGNQCSLVLLQEEALPSIIPLYKLTDYGMTLGMTLAKTYEDNVFALSTNSDTRFCEGSDAQAMLEDVSDPEAVRIVDIGDTKLSSDMLTEINTVKDLVGGSDYKVTYYVGSYYKTIAITADTHAFAVAKGSIKSVSSFSYTQNGYVELNLPDDIDKGYYYIDGAGMFYYDPGITGGFLSEQ